MSDPTECVFVDSDTRYNRKNTVLDRSAEPHRRIDQRRNAVFHTDLTGDSIDADCALKSVASASRTQQQQQEQQQCSVTYKLTG